jgi:hypothetical protein
MTMRSSRLARVLVLVRVRLPAAVAVDGVRLVRRTGDEGGEALSRWTAVAKPLARGEGGARANGVMGEAGKTEPRRGERTEAN